MFPCRLVAKVPKSRKCHAIVQQFRETHCVTVHSTLSSDLKRQVSEKQTLGIWQKIPNYLKVEGGVHGWHISKIINFTSH